mmetsp:Transcript_13094/g.14510  ORF Transcript_13094/g.14510 Transcript_13094/m.14510 type:complete len:209 (+) Transcript_13094:745-1371(+)
MNCLRHVESPSMPSILPQCEWQSERCLCDASLYICTGELVGVVKLPAIEMRWKSPLITSNNSVIVFQENSSIVLEKCHNISGEMVVDFVPKTESTRTLAQVEYEKCYLDNIRISFAKNSGCIKGTSRVRDSTLIAVFSDTCKTKSQIIPIAVTSIIVIIIMLLTCTIIMVYKPIRSKVFPFHMSKKEVNNEKNYITTVQISPAKIVTK